MKPIVLSVLLLAGSGCHEAPERERVATGSSSPTSLYRLAEEDVCDHAFWDQNENIISYIKEEVTQLKQGVGDRLTSYVGNDRCSRDGWNQVVTSIHGLYWAIEWLPTMLNPQRTGCKPEMLASMRKELGKLEKGEKPLDANEASEFLSSRSPPKSTFDTARYVDRSVLDRLPRKEVLEQDLQLGERLCRCRQRDVRKLFDGLQAARDDLALWLKDGLPQLVVQKCGKGWLSDADIPPPPPAATPL
jgi:hypothetical protein